ncbi:hypothetical protein C3747_261g46 [Trypanosoma cruzi]|uniref:Uncharacterized protein n=1 Tax=Trypanosoma cruzi TaxID=5693 RepID=A0A2V2VIQ9_TRYCR|nr:hypothetical protein C3747_261g46 [Trypanosoma cruzi]
MPSYLPDTVVLQLYRHDGEAEFADYMNANSLTFVALGDAERPALCGIDATRSYTTKGPNEHWCRQQELSPAFAAVVCVFPSACQNSVSCCAERTTRKKATATIASLVLPDGFIGSRLFGCRVGGGIVPLSLHDLSCWQCCLDRDWIRHKGSCR